MKIAIITDAWQPQVNGVVRTLGWMEQELGAAGHELLVVGPDRFAGFPCPTYPEIRLALWPGRRLASILDGFAPHAIHIATEGPLGFAGRRYCLKRGFPFTTAIHTRFPEYLQARIGLPPDWIYAIMRRFHAPAARVMVATEGLRQELAMRGFRNLALWSRGVDVELFRPDAAAGAPLPFARPIWLFVGRVAVEKNIEDFLALDLPGTKLVVGDGPKLEELRRRHPAVEFAGARFGAELARHYAASDVFVFPSRTDTFGLVLLEALASGLPVAAYPVCGPRDVIGDAPVGCLDEDLAQAARKALAMPRERCRAFALGFSWVASAAQFLANLQPFDRTTACSARETPGPPDRRQEGFRGHPRSRTRRAP
jgi:glycosyltransferase involved in cell wall biosynthesis